LEEDGLTHSLVKTPGPPSAGGHRRSLIYSCVSRVRGHTF